MLQILTKISKFCSVLKQEKKVDFSILSNLESQVAHLRAYETSMFWHYSLTHFGQRYPFLMLYQK